MRIAYFDCFSGASGDMILGSLIDAGLSPRLLREELKKIDIPTVQIQVKRVLKGGLSATRVIVRGERREKIPQEFKRALKDHRSERLSREIKEK